MRVIPLSPPDSTTYRNIAKWFKRLKISESFVSQRINKVVLIGNGSPDDIVISLLLYRFNGVKGLNVGILKSKFLGLEVIRSVAIILRSAYVNIRGVFNTY